MALTSYEKVRLTQAALDQLGKPYIFGYEVRLKDIDPPAFDCSELIQWLYYQAGYIFVDGSWNQFDHCDILDSRKDALATGDLVFASRGTMKIGHVGVIIIPQKEIFDVIEALNPRIGVHKIHLADFMRRSSFAGVGRPKKSLLRKIL